MNTLLLWMLLFFGAAHAAQEASDFEEMGVALAEAPLEEPPAPMLAAERTDRLSSALRCPVCQGMSVAGSPSDAARAMAARIEELVGLGYTEDQITEYFIERYGPWVELEPPAEGRHLLLFVAPGVVLVFGLLVLLMRQRRNTPASQAGPAFVPDPSLAPYRERIRAELEGRSS